MGLFKRKKQTEKGPCAAVVPAAGRSIRMAGIDKMFADIDGVPVLARTLLALEACPEIGEIVVVTREDLMPMTWQLVSDNGLTKVANVVKGGDSRPESVYNGVQAVSADMELIAVHDGARPFVTPEMVSETVRAAKKYHAAAPGVKVKDTVKTVKYGKVTNTPDRDSLYLIQTPQIFDADLLRAALKNALDKKLAVTDDCSAAEALGAEIRITQGSYTNIKITTPEDIYLGEAILKMERDTKK